MSSTGKNPVRRTSAPGWFILVSFFTILFGSVYGQSGEELFRSNCAVCHKVTADKFVGPGLLDVAQRRSREWLVAWTKNSQELISSGDADAVAIFAEYNNSVMPPFDFLGDEAINAIFDYIEAGPPAADPSETTLTQSTGTETTTTAEPKKEKGFLYWLIVVVVIGVAWMLYSIYRSIHKAMDENGYLDYKNYNKNYLLTFLKVAAIASIVVYLLTLALASNTPGFMNLMFGTLPYIALAVFFIGTIYRYRTNGYKVSSLSTQFLEGRRLFFGSQPFHWGMLVLFFGHLIAFLVPKAVILWNGHPVRLLILEVASLAFALSALIGLVLLIRRRFSSPKVMVVTNNMDTVVYVLLLIQIISGISVALFARWGSTWFASSLTPYLRSIFTFDPKVGIAVAMPWFAQLHIIGAFVIIAVIPFTRFMHFLVVPLSYIGRKYQVVYWNWNRRSIRKSTAHTYGKVPRNH